MRRCGRSDELRDLLAAETELPRGLAEHVPSCAECTRTYAAARRFESRLDTAMAELVTDALPPTTVPAAHMAPSSAGRRRSVGLFVSAVATAAVVGFAGVGIVSTGASLADAMRGGSATDAPAVDAELVECQAGDASVAVEVEQVGSGSPTAVVTYCVVLADGQSLTPAVTCVRTMPRAAPAPTSDQVDDGDAYLGACSRVREAARGRADEDVPSEAVPSTPFRSWDEARSAVSWSVLRPDWLPEGYALAALQGFGSATSEDPDSVTATYLRNGTPLSVEQFLVWDPGAFRIELSLPSDQLADVTTGRTTVDGHAAFWADGVVATTAHGPELNVQTLMLTWADDSVGYRITARSEDLETLLRIAESLDGG